MKGFLMYRNDKLPNCLTSHSPYCMVNISYGHKYNHIWLKRKINDDIHCPVKKINEYPKGHLRWQEQEGQLLLIFHSVNSRCTSTFSGTVYSMQAHSLEAIGNESQHLYIISYAVTCASSCSVPNLKTTQSLGNQICSILN